MTDSVRQLFRRISCNDLYWLVVYGSLVLILSVPITVLQKLRDAE